MYGEQSITGYFGLNDGHDRLCEVAHNRALGSGGKR